MATYYHETFSDIFQFINAITSRPNNSCGGLSNHSETNSNSFAGMSYNQSLEKIKTGIPEKKELLEKAVMEYAGSMTGTGTRVKCHYTGYAPNVARAIIGYPKAMYKREKTPKRAKTIEIIYNMVQNCNVDAKDIERGAIATLNLIYSLELSGIKCKLSILAYCAESDDEYAICQIMLKDYAQPFDFLKLSFPLTQVAMFRRLGFKWIETFPKIHEFWSAYGHSLNKNDAKDALKNCNLLPKHAIYIDLSIWKDIGYDVSKMIEKINKDGEN